MSFKIQAYPADKWFSLCVRERAGNRCEVERCGRTAEHWRLDCSHFMSRRHMATRWCPENAWSHCFLCHRKFTDDPVEFVRWAEGRIGPAKVEELRKRSQVITKLTKKDKVFISRHYRKEYETMLEKRRAGETGYLQFRPWWEG